MLFLKFFDITYLFNEIHLNFVICLMEILFCLTCLIVLMFFDTRDLFNGVFIYLFIYLFNGGFKLANFFFHFFFHL